MFKDLIQKVRHLGIDNTSTRTTRHQVVNFNSLLLFASVVLFFSLSTNVITRSWTSYDSIVYFGSYSIIAIGLILNSQGFFKVSSVFSHLAFSLLFCSAAIISGGVFVCCTINLIWMVISFRFMQSPQEGIIISFIQLTFVICTIIIVANTEYGHTENHYDPISRSIVYGLMFIFLFIIAKFFTDQIRDNVNKVNNLVGELEHKNKKIQMAYHEMENFAHKISHDLKAPLRNMNAFAVLLKKDIQKNKDHNLEQYSEKIYSNGIKLSKMIDDVLAYSKLNADLDKSIESIELEEIIIPIKDSMKRIYPSAEIKLLSTGKINSSHTKLTMLLQNLIENGLKYNESPIPTVTINFANKDGQNTIDVTDNGIGIPSEYHEQIFDLFSRLHTDQEFQGTGIGLSTCKKIVEEHLNGELNVHSNKHEGSTFTIEFPSN